MARSMSGGVLWRSVVVTIIVFAGAVAGTASAPVNAAPAFGALVVHGGDWLGGAGVDIYSNGSTSYVSNSYSAPAVGMKWQCVELAQRLYKARGWFGGIFNGVSAAADIWNWAPSHGMVDHPNGSG